MGCIRASGEVQGKGLNKGPGAPSCRLFARFSGKRKGGTQIGVTLEDAGHECPRNANENIFTRVEVELQLNELVIKQAEVLNRERHVCSVLQWRNDLADCSTKDWLPESVSNFIELQRNVSSLVHLVPPCEEFVRTLVHSPLAGTVRKNATVRVNSCQAESDQLCRSANNRSSSSV